MGEDTRQIIPAGPLAPPFGRQLCPPLQLLEASAPTPNRAEEINATTRALLSRLAGAPREPHLCALFFAGPGLDAAFPATAARAAGWGAVALLGAQGGASGALCVQLLAAPTAGWRALRGAIPAEPGQEEAAAATLLAGLAARNQLAPGACLATLLTTTPDLGDALAPPGDWGAVALGRELGVPGAAPRLVRALLLVQSQLPARHWFVGRAARLRPDLAEEST